jgi:CRISPR system Cascade subunit CasB
MGRKAEIETFVGRKIYILQAEADLSSGKAMLANLRRGVGREPGELPQLFGILLSDMPEDFWSKSGTATKEEWVCYTALTLYALHQQGYDAKSQHMHTDEGVSLGKAMYKLAASYDGDPNAEQRVVQKMRILATSADVKELSHHLRGIVQLLKANGISLNYKRLAGDLYEMQFPDGKRKVCLRWGQDFYGGRDKKDNQESKSGEEKR